MLDHVGFAVSDAERSRRFYEQALAPLGMGLIMSVTPEQTESGGTAHGFGSDGKPYFWVGDNERVGEGTHCRIPSGNTREGGCLPRRGTGGGRSRQWRAGPEAALSSELLRCLRARSRRVEH